MTKPRSCIYCGQPVILSRHNNRTMVLIGPTNDVTADLIWHTECDPFNIKLTVETSVTAEHHPPTNPQSEEIDP